MDLKERRILGRSGLTVGRLGVSCTHGAPTEAFEEAFEHGANYFYWGSLRRSNMVRAMRNISAKGKRDQLVVLIQVYNRIPSMLAGSVERGLRKSGLEYADVLLLGWRQSLPCARTLEAAQKLKDEGKIRFLAMSGHKRPAFPKIAEKGIFDIFHVRYNAVHRGAETEIFPQLPKEGRPGIVVFTATCVRKLLTPGKMPPGEKIPRGSDCYRFVLSNPDVDVCMASPKDRDQMREALKTLELGPLSTKEMDRMRRIGDHIHGK